MGSQGAGHTIDGVVVPFLWAIDIGSRDILLMVSTFLGSRIAS